MMWAQLSPNTGPAYSATELRRFRDSVLPLTPWTASTVTKFEYRAVSEDRVAFTHPGSLYLRQTRHRFTRDQMTDNPESQNRKLALTQRLLQVYYEQ